MKIDHVGYAVKNMEKAQNAMRVLGYVFGPTVGDEARGVWISFGELDGYRIELVAPMRAGEPSPVDGYLKKMGNTPYHICYRSQDIEEDIRRLAQKGFRISAPPAPAIAFGGGQRVAFLYSLSLGLIELVESDKNDERKDGVCGI